MSDSSRELTLIHTLPVAHPPADVDLLHRVAAGDEAAFAELYDLYAPPVYNYLLRLVNERSVAEEILQEVFLAMWQSADRFRWIVHSVYPRIQKRITQRDHFSNAGLQTLFPDRPSCNCIR